MVTRRVGRDLGNVATNPAHVRPVMRYPRLFLRDRRRAGVRDFANFEEKLGEESSSWDYRGEKGLGADPHFWQVRLPPFPCQLNFKEILLQSQV